MAPSDPGEGPICCDTPQAAPHGEVWNRVATVAGAGVVAAVLLALIVDSATGPPPGAAGETSALQATLGQLGWTSLGDATVHEESGFALGTRHEHMAFGLSTKAEDGSPVTARLDIVSVGGNMTRIQLHETRGRVTLEPILDAFRPGLAAQIRTLPTDAKYFDQLREPAELDGLAVAVWWHSRDDQMYPRAFLICTRAYWDWQTNRVGGEAKKP